MKICRLCNKEFPSSILVEGVRIVFSSRKYCLDCSPYKTHNTKILEDVRQSKTHKLCCFCENVLEISNFYKRRDGTGVVAYCKSCTTHQTLERQRKLKKLAVEYKGGACIRCGFSGHPAVFDFHHRDKSEKSFGISRYKNTNINEKLKQELDKCDLLCANCHRIVTALY